MKCLYLTFLVLIFSKVAFSQSGTWTWMNGDSITGSEAHYGIKGIPSVLNHPSALYEPSQWTDNNGDFWLYGGIHANASFMTFENTMWRFSPSSNEWTWMSGDTVSQSIPVYGIRGMPSPLNTPGAVSYGSATASDNAGNLWLFGGYIYPHGITNQLWKYNILLNQWTWISGDTIFNSIGHSGIQGVPSVLNVPPSVSETAAAWWENGNFWVFGGASDLNVKNDLWKYNSLTNEWTWMKGVLFVSAPAVHGMKGIEDPYNDPGGRYSYSHWKDNTNFWIFGGSDINSNCYSDMWRYSLFTNNWTWMSGSDLPNQLGFYNQYCENDPQQYPASRMENKVCWTDTCGNFWMMGGRGVNAWSLLNDLWRYHSVTSQWKFVNGDSTYDAYGNYGSMGVPSLTNKCPARNGAVSWRSNNGDLWLFGGVASRSFPSMHINDMWRYTPDTSCSSCSYPTFNLQATDTSFCPGTCIDFISTNNNVSMWQWYFPGGNPAISNLPNPGGICYALPGLYDVTLIAGNSSLMDTLFLHNYIEVYPNLMGLSITQSGDTLISNQGALTSYQWYFDGNLISGATEYYFVATAGGDYNVIVTDSNGCEAEAAIFNVIAFSENPDLKENYFQLIPNPATEEIEIVMSDNQNKFDVKIFDMPGVLQVQIDNISSHSKIDVSSLKAGVYFIEIADKNSRFRKRFVKR